jgi:hypothetical protein
LKCLKNQTYESSTKDLVNEVFHQFPPKLFITLWWNDFPREPIKSTSHSRHFKNVLLYNLYDVSKVQDLPKFPDRFGMMFFQERKEHTINGKHIQVFHTHIHLYNDQSKLIRSSDHLTRIIRSKCSPHIRKLFKGEKEGLMGVNVEYWDRERHSGYNFKDLYHCKYQQDGDIVLDYQNSDIPKLRRINDHIRSVHNRQHLLQTEND